MMKAARLLLICAVAAFPARGFAQAVGETRSVHILEEAPGGAPASPEPAPGAPPIAPAKPKAGKSRDGVYVEVLPQKDFQIGEPMSFRVTVDKPGYLVLVDVDAQGKLAQIFPNMLTLADPAGVDEKANYLKAGQSLLLPDGAASAIYRFIASPPTGVGMVVAILSDVPVQVIDLPDVPAALAGQSGGAEFIRDATRSLQILPAGAESLPTRAPKWAFATVFYEIK